MTPPRFRVTLKDDSVWERLDRLNMEAKELARLAEITPGYLSLLISRKRSPSASVRKLIQKALRAEGFDDLFQREPTDE